MKRVEAIKRVKHFLSKNGIEDDFVLDSEHTLSESHKPYYIYTDVERRGCFESESYFATKIEVNEFLDDLFSDGIVLDKIYIFDVKKNKIVKPRI